MNIDVLLAAGLALAAGVTYRAFALVHAHAQTGRPSRTEGLHARFAVRRAAFPITVGPSEAEAYEQQAPIPARRTLGAGSGRRKPFQPGSVVTLAANISEPGRWLPASINDKALGTAAAHAGCAYAAGHVIPLDPTETAPDLILQLGGDSGSACEVDGRFSLARLIELTDSHRAVRAVEIVLATPAASRLPFSDADSLLDFCESIAGATGLPVGLRGASGDLPFWRELAALSGSTRRTMDFITVSNDQLADLVPFAIDVSRLQRLLAVHALYDRVALVGSSSAWDETTGIVAFTLGCDLLELRTEKAASARRLAMRVANLRRQLQEAAYACGAMHPADVGTAAVEVYDATLIARTLAEAFGGRGVGSVCGDERRLIDLADRHITPALAFRRRH